MRSARSDASAISDGRRMAQAPRDEEDGSVTRAGSRPQAPATAHPWLLLLAAAGLLLSSYLAWARLAGATLVCVVGSGCGTVQSSRYASAFGIPVALLGVLFYAALIGLAARPLTGDRRFALAMPVAAAGVGASAVFTIVQQVSLRATCFPCVISALLTAAIAAVLVAGRPHRIRAGTWAMSTVALVAAVVFLLGGYAASRPPAGAQPYAEALARHLTASGVTMYGAYWCSACTNQKALFGKAAGLLPYVECDARSPIGQTQRCVAAQIRAFPTWDIAGRRYEGVLSLEQLAQLTGFRLPP